VLKPTYPLEWIIYLKSTLENLEGYYFLVLPILLLHEIPLPQLVGVVLCVNDRTILKGQILSISLPST
jgi:hypothetical protein